MAPDLRQQIQSPLYMTFTKMKALADKPEVCNLERCQDSLDILPLKGDNEFKIALGCFFTSACMVIATPYLG